VLKHFGTKLSVESVGVEFRYAMTIGTFLSLNPKIWGKRNTQNYATGNNLNILS
jgi:hypothetical protein